MKLSVVVDLLLSNKDMVDRLDELISERREMNEASLDASVYNKGDRRSYLEKLPEFELVNIIEELSKNQKGMLEEDDNHQDINNDATIKGQQSLPSNPKVTGGKKECLGGLDQQSTYVGTATCPTNLEDQTPNISYHINDDLPVELNASNADEEEEKEDVDLHNQQAFDYRGLDRKRDSMTPQNSNEEKIEEMGEKQHLQPPGDPLQAGEESAESDEESSDSKSSNGGSDSSGQPGTALPVQPFADDDRNILRATEQIDQTPVLLSRNQDNSESHDSFLDQDVLENQLADAPNRQIPNLHQVVERLSETALNNSQVIATLTQANEHSQHIRQTSSSIVEDLREENNRLNDEMMDLEQHCQQLQEQNAAHEESLMNQESSIRSLRQWRSHLHHQNAALEDVIQSQNEQKEGDKKIIECLVKKNKKLQEELNMANKRAYEVAQKREEDLGCWLDTKNGMTMAIQQIHRKYLAEKERNKLIKLEELEEKWKEKRLEEATGCVRLPRTQLRDLQVRIGLQFLADEEKNLNPQDDEEDDVD